MDAGAKNDGTQAGRPQGGKGVRSAVRKWMTASGARSSRRRLVALALLVPLAVYVATALARAPAPQLSLAGATLHWTSVTGATKYEVQTIVGQKRATARTTERTAPVHQTHAKSKYRVRAAEPETGAWSNAIVVPGAAETGKEEKQQEKEEKKKEREEEKEKPKEEPEEERGPITFSPGINAGPEKAFDVPGATTLGAKTARISVEYNEVSGSFIAEEASWYVNKGTTPLILFDFTGKMPSAAQAKGITALARIPGLKLIEFGNETNYNYQYKDEPSQASYKARARLYAERFVEAAQALKPFGIGLLAQGSPGSTKSSVWLNEMFAAEPELTKYVSGWTVHPYGTKGPSEMEETVADLAAHGDRSLPIDVTEWGVATDNGRALEDNFGFPVNMTYAQAGAQLKESVATLRRAAGGRLRSFIVYQVRDQQKTGASTSREAYFGALQHELQKKGAYTEAVQALMKE